MKKILCICLTLIMVMGLSVSAFAAPGAFVESPSNNQAPELIEGKNEDEDCDARIIVTAYADRETLPEDLREKIEYAYDHIVKTHDLGNLNEELDKLAETLGVDSKYLAVSDMFDVRMDSCDDHELHGDFNITLKPESLKNFVGLLHYFNNTWHLVDSAEVIGTDKLHFVADHFSPFAIVVYNTPEDDGQGGAPGTGDSSNIMPYVIIMIVSAAAVAVLLIVLLKKKSKKEAE